MKKRFLFAALGLAIMVACTKPEIQPGKDNVADSTNITETVVVENDSVNSDAWLERWVYQVSGDTVAPYYNYPVSPAWFEFRLTRYGDDSVFLFSRTMMYPTYDYAPNRQYTMQTEMIWNRCPFMSSYPQHLSISGDTVTMTSGAGDFIKETRYVIMGQSANEIDLKLVSEETRFQNNPEWNTYLDETTLHWREKLHIYRQ